MPAFESRAADWLPLSDARSRVLARAGTPESRILSVPGAAGLALASAVTAPITLPPLDSSAMDGYAVRAADIGGATADHPARLRVTGRAFPGSAPGPGPGSGEAIRIFTGAPVPAQADSVVRVEDTDREDGEEGVVAILRDRDSLRNVRPAGEDVRAGETVLLSGTPVEAGTIALLAGLGIRTVPVHPPPAVAILSTGDELVPAFEDPGAARVPDRPVRDSNGPALAAAVRQAGGMPRGPHLVPDDPQALRRAVEEASSEADLLLVTGGASMGEADLVKRVLDRMGFQLDFWRVLIRPGSPFGFGVLPRQGRPPLPVAGLPGNPASALVTFEILVRPLLRALGGHARIHRLLVDARAAEPLPGLDGLTHLVRVRLERHSGRWEARAAGPQRSNLLAPLARAHGIAEIPPGPGPAPGDPVTVHLLTADTDVGIDGEYEPR